MSAQTRAGPAGPATSARHPSPAVFLGSSLAVGALPRPVRPRLCLLGLGCLVLPLAAVPAISSAVAAGWLDWALRPGAQRGREAGRGAGCGAGGGRRGGRGLSYVLPEGAGCLASSAESIFFFGEKQPPGTSNAALGTWSAERSRNKKQKRKKRSVSKNKGNKAGRARDQRRRDRSTSGYGHGAGEFRHEFLCANAFY
jgi:hypothetical protein